MNTRIEKIRIAAQKREEERKKKEEKQLELVEDYKNRIFAFFPRINELVKIGNELIKNRFFNDEFGADTHRLGFVFEDNHVVGMGVLGCGEHLEVNTHGKISEYSLDTSNSEQMSRFCNRCIRFLKEFDEFEKSVYDYVDNL